MKIFLVFACTVLAATLAVHFAGAADSPAPATAPSAAAVPSSGDAGTDLVEAFYQALLQPEPPTREQELALFAPNSALRTRLVLNPHSWVDIEPMKRTPEQIQQRKLDDEKVAAAGPVVLQFCREHKELFLPKGMRSAGDIQISSSFHWVRSVARMKEPQKPGNLVGGYVLAFFADNPTAVTKTHTVVFPYHDGKIDCDSIFLEGVNGRPLDAEFAAPP